MIYERLQARFVTLKKHTKLCGAIFLRLGTQFDVFDLYLSLQKPSLIINRLRYVIILKNIISCNAKCVTSAIILSVSAFAVGSKNCSGLALLIDVFALLVGGTVIVFEVTMSSPVVLSSLEVSSSTSDPVFNQGHRFLISCDLFLG